MDARRMQTSSKNNQTISICEQLNLDISKLDDQTLLMNPTYRRLVNIVKNDMSRSDHSFRKNLIRELYFLLQITPIIRPQLKEQFLIEVEKMYNLNDHKKIDLASNKLNNILRTVNNNKKQPNSGGAERPKTGVAWNQNVSPFLRPYTAIRERGTKNSKISRPISSKFGSQSTKVQTLEDFCIRQFTTNIQEELQISRDFIQKHRTSHPDYEPIYEQLYNILKKIETKEAEEPIDEPKLVPKAQKYPKSAITRHKEVNWVRPQNQSQQCIGDDPQVESENEEVKDLKKDQQKGSDNESSEQQQYLFVNEEKKPYKAFSKEIKIEQSMPDNKLDENLHKYTHLVGTKVVQALREDQQMAKKYVHYARVKSALKRELNRKNESRRLMSAKPSNGANIKVSKIVTDEDKQNLQNEKAVIIDLTKDQLNVPADQINTYPTYNQRQLLKDLYEQPISQFKRRNHIGYSHSTDAKMSSAKRPMTAYTRFHSPIRFDPFSPQNIKQYNAGVLQEIQKIKVRLGGKSYASTESLTKALAIEMPFKQDLPHWENKNIFYGMISANNGKKLKKRNRKNVKLNRKGLNRK